MAKKLWKSRKDKKIDGVCAGIANYFNIDVTIVRLVFVALVFFKGAGILLYIIGAIVMPVNEDEIYEDESVENLKSANVESDESVKNESAGERTEGVHSDEEFENFFKKD